MPSACRSDAEKSPASKTQPKAAPRKSAMPDQELSAALLRAVKDKGPSYRARTRHLNPDGSPKYTNRLMLESSPYLLQHAHNPVNWFPWGEEAFQIAKELGRPVFLSVGYSTCHWCHVMEEESFEDEEVARYLNDHYIAIKVDREERPDVDSIYMAAVQALTGRGGWPMSVWMTPAREPFYGGTYFPPRDGARGGQSGFLTLLKANAEAFQAGDKDLTERVAELTQHLKSAFAVSAATNPVPRDVLTRAADIAARRFDAVNGGARGAPKFPSNFPVRVLWRHHRNTGDATALKMAALTLEKMSAGGMYDHVAGGFHRYSTDARWLVPHFEKMLYDNALLVLAYLEGYQVTGSAEFARVARETLDYVAREMTAPSGYFYAATDADSVGPQGHLEEGYYFTWTPAELAAHLTPAEVKLARAYYNVTDGGNFEGRSVLETPRSRADVAAELRLSLPEFNTQLDAVRGKLLAARNLRPAPLRDEKILASWNGLMLSAFARGAQVLGESRYRDVARRAATSLFRELHGEQETAGTPGNKASAGAPSAASARLRHSLTHGRHSSVAFLEDYSFLAAGLLDTFEATGEVVFLDQSLQLMQELEQHHADTKSGGYFLTADDAEGLLAREKPDADMAIPNGNSLALMNQLRLAEFTGEPQWKARATSTLRAFSKALGERPHSLDEMLLGVDYFYDRPKEIAVVLPNQGNREDAVPLLRVLQQTFLPNRVLVVSEEAQLTGELAKRLPWTAEKIAQGGKPTAYVCEEGLCELPTSSPSVLAEQLKRPARTPAP